MSWSDLNIQTWCAGSDACAYPTDKVCDVHQLAADLMRLRSDLRRLRAENQWLRNRRNRAVELLTGNPGDDPMFIAADLMETLADSKQDGSDDA